MPNIRKPLSRGWTIAVLLVFMTAAPAVAAVIIQNFIAVEVTSAPACFVKYEGQDGVDFDTAGQSPFVNTDTANTIVTTDGVTLLQEKIEVEGHEGDRVIFSDVIRYRNECDYDIEVQLIAQPDVNGNAAVDGDWSDKAVRVWLSDNALASGLAAGAPIPATYASPSLVWVDTDVSGTRDVGEPGYDWDQAPVEVTPAGLGNAATGTVTLAPGEEAQGAVLVDISTPAASTTGTLRYTATATPQP